MKKGIAEIIIVIIMVLVLTTCVDGKEKCDGLTLMGSTPYNNSIYGTAYHNWYVDDDNFVYSEWVSKDGKQIIPLDKVMLDDGTQSRFHVDIIYGELE